MLAFSREVWRALLTSLHARNFVDLVPGQSLHELSLDELIHLAKRTVQGPRSWSASDNSTPVIARQISLNPDLPPNSDGFDAMDKAKLLSGGQFLLFTYRGRLRCWSVAHDRHVWEYHGHWNSSSVNHFTAEVIEGGRAAMIAVVSWVPAGMSAGLHLLYDSFSLGLRVMLNRLNSERFVDFVYVDFLQGTGYSVFLHPVPPPIRDRGVRYLSIKFCGDFAVLLLGPRLSHEWLCLLKLSTRSCRTFTLRKVC